jgi:HCOMODA/2-hydroxy-3-carboxy-muconic semialdehyde decarboxylase
MLFNFSRRQFCGGWAKLLAFFPMIGGTPLMNGDSKEKVEKESPLSDLVVANHILAAKEVVDGYGHVSVRDPGNPNRYLLARSMAPALVTASDIMTFDVESNPVGGDARQSYIERFIHGEIYRVRPDVQAIVHCHSPELIPFGATGVAMRPLYHMTAFMNPGVPVYEIRDFRAPSDKSMLVHNRELGQALAHVLADKSALLMRGHGGVLVASTLPQVVGRSVYLKINAEMQSEALALGRTINYLEPGEDAGPTVSSFGRDWDVWKVEAESDDE